MKYLLAILMMFIFGSCVRKSTNDPDLAYQYWAGQKPPKEVDVVHGNYSSSANFTKEYVTYLELKASPLWCSEMIRQNNLRREIQYTIPKDAPVWFQPAKECRIWRSSGFDQGSFYVEDTVSGHMFIYAIHL